MNDDGIEGWQSPCDAPVMECLHESRYEITLSACVELLRGRHRGSLEDGGIPDGACAVKCAVVDGMLNSSINLISCKPCDHVIRVVGRVPAGR